MIIEGISFQGFRSFMDDETMKIPKHPGVYLITGENKLEPKLGANGVGKSSFAEGLCWAFYGKTSKGHRAKDISNWADEHLTTVSVDFQIRGEAQNITRRWNPNALLWQTGSQEPWTIEQCEVENQIGLSYDLFLATVLFAQDGNGFMDLGSTAQAKALAKVLGLDVWEVRSKKAKDKASAAKRDLEKVEKQMVQMKAEKKALIEQQNALCDREESWKAQQDEAEKTLLLQLEEADKAQVDAFSDKEESEKESRAVGSVQNKHQRTLVGLRAKHFTESERKSGLQVREAEIKTLLNAQREGKERQERLSRMDQGICPTCSAEIDPDAVAANIEAFADTIAGHRVDLSEVRDQMDVVLDEMNRIDILESDVIAKGHESDEKRSKIAMRYQACLDACRRADSGIQIIQNQIKKLREETNPHTSLLDEIDQKIDKIIAFIKNRDSYRAVLEVNMERYAYWVQGFIRLRLWILERAMAEFTAKMSNSFDQLGLEGWEVFCQTEKELSDGTKKAAFNLMIKSPQSPHPIAWGLWSGGEEQRLKIAGCAAYSDLVCDRMGVRPSMEIWDEPTQHLSGTGCDDLMSFFKHRSIVLKKQVWVIDHRTLDSGEVDAHWRFVKDYRGTHIEAMG